MVKQIEKTPVGKVSESYHGFPLDHLVNFTSVAGYLIPVYFDFLEPGDKIKFRTLLRTFTETLAAPAMATIVERIEWFAVPVEQLYKLFGSQFYGIQDIDSDWYTDALGAVDPLDNTLPYITLSDLKTQLVNMHADDDNVTSSVSAVDAAPTFSESYRLLTSLGVPQGIMTNNFSGLYAGSINIWYLAAYQKIWYDCFRMTDRIVNSPKAYNFDSLYVNKQVTQGNLSDIADRGRLLKLRRRPYMSDYFTSTQVSPSFASGDISAAGNDLTALEQWYTSLSGFSTGVPSTSSLAPNGGTVVADTDETTTVFLSNNVNSSNVSSVGGFLKTFNPANIRSMFAVEKLLEVTRRAKKHYDMQTLAHFGVEVPKGLSGEVMRIGSHKQYIKINDVLSTTNNSDSVLGQRGGVGNSESESGYDTFEAKSHCVIMALYSAEPVCNYRNMGLDRLVTMTDVSEYYKPEFDNLGMQPVFQREINLFQTSSAVSGLAGVAGWQPRYMQNKDKFNRSFGGIATNYFKEWTINRRQQTIFTGSDVEFYYSDPRDMNDILYTTYGTNIASADSEDDVFARDYLINQIYFDVVKTSKKSIYGLPKL